MMIFLQDLANDRLTSWQIMKKWGLPHGYWVTLWRIAITTEGRVIKPEYLRFLKASPLSLVSFKPNEQTKKAASPR